MVQISTFAINATLLYIHKFQPMKLQLQLFTATSEIHCFYMDFNQEFIIYIII